MIDIKLIREQKELVKENIKKKFQEEKLPLVDEVYELDEKWRDSRKKADELRSEKNKLAKEIGQMMSKGKKEEAEATKEKVKKMNEEIATLEQEEISLENEIKTRMMVIPQIMDPSVPIG